MGKCANCGKETDLSYNYYYAGTVISRNIQRDENLWGDKTKSITTKYGNIVMKSAYFCDTCGSEMVSEYHDLKRAIAFFFLFLITTPFFIFMMIDGVPYIVGYIVGGLFSLIGILALLVSIHHFIQIKKFGFNVHPVPLSSNEEIIKKLILYVHGGNKNKNGIQVYFTPNEHMKLQYL